jgi:hypothetical protein
MILSTNDSRLGGFRCMDMTLHGMRVQFCIFKGGNCNFSYLPLSFVSRHICPSLTDNWYATFLREPLWGAIPVRYDHQLIPYLYVYTLYFSEYDNGFVGPYQELENLAQMLGAVLECAKQIKGADLQ